jgi:uncharacterized protein YjbI with pentapeptide repeats
MLSSEGGFTAYCRLPMSKPVAKTGAHDSLSNPQSPIRTPAEADRQNPKSDWSLPVTSQKAAHRSGFDRQGAVTPWKLPKNSNGELSGTNRTPPELRRLHLRGANLAMRDLSRSDLRHADLRDANLQGAILQQFPFRADLKGANLAGTDLSHIVSDRPVRFSGPFDGRGAVYDGETLFPAGYNPASEGLIRLEPGADVSGLNLGRLPAAGMNLQGTNLSGAILRNAHLRGANLRGADLSGARLQGTDLSGIIVDGGTRFSGATYSDATRFPEDFNPALHGLVLDNPLPIANYLKDTPDGIALLDWTSFQA